MGERAELDVLALGMMMGEVAPPRAGLAVGEAPGMVLFPSGSTTIFALALARLGGRVGLLSRVGDDDLGRWMRRALTAAGIDTGGVTTVAGQLTPLALASVDERGRKSFAFYRFPGHCDPLATLRAAEVSDATLRRARVFDVGEASLRSPVLRTETLALIERARALGRTVCYTPNYRPAAWSGGPTEAAAIQRAAVARADIALMNAEEARLIGGGEDDAAAARAVAALGPRTVVVTAGAAGALVVADGEATRVAAVPVEVVFDIGAGDTFHAGFLAAWAAGADPIESARFASQAAALKISRPPDPALLPTRAEVLAAMG